MTTQPALPSVSNGLSALNTALQEQPLLTLQIYSYGMMMRRLTPDKGVVEYPVSPEQVATALSAKVRFETGLLSGNTLYMASEGIQRIVIEYRRPQKTAIFLAGSETPLRVPLPGLVLARIASGNDNPRYAIFAVKERPTLETLLFHTPLPNTANNAICWGSVNKVSAAGLASSVLDEDWSMLLGTQFNNHGVHGKSTSHPNDIRQKLIDIEKRQSRVYPTRDLVPVNAKFGDLIKKVQDGATYL